LAVRSDAGFLNSGQIAIDHSSDFSDKYQPTMQVKIERSCSAIVQGSVVPLFLIVFSAFSVFMVPAEQFFNRISLVFLVFLCVVAFQMPGFAGYVGAVTLLDKYVQSAPATVFLVAVTAVLSETPDGRDHSDVIDLCGFIIIATGWVLWNVLLVFGVSRFREPWASVEKRHKATEIKVMQK